MCSAALTSIRLKYVLNSAKILNTLLPAMANSSGMIISERDLGQMKCYSGTLYD